MAIVITDPEYVLRGVAGEAFGRSYHLLSPTVVGRAPECDISINAAGLSRTHARLRPTRDGVEIQDLDSTNGSFLNGQRIATGLARPGDEIVFDQLRFRLADVRGVAHASPAPRSAHRARGHGVWWAMMAIVAVGVAAAFTYFQS
jgi:hypothetical protein